MLFHDVPALPAEVWMPALPLLDYVSGFSNHALDLVTRLCSLASGGFWTAPRSGGQMASPPNGQMQAQTAPGTTWSICPPKRGAVLACVWWHWWHTVWFCSYSPQAQLGANLNKTKQYAINVTKHRQANQLRQNKRRGHKAACNHSQHKQSFTHYPNRHQKQWRTDSPALDCRIQRTPATWIVSYRRSSSLTPLYGASMTSPWSWKPSHPKLTRRTLSSERR